MIHELEKMTKEERILVDIELSAHSISGAVCSIRKSIKELNDKDFFNDANQTLELMELNLDILEFKMWKFSKRNGEVKK